MAAPSYTQSMLDAPLRMPAHGARAQGADSDGDLSSIPDISTVATYSDTDGEHPPIAPLEGRRRGIINTIRSKLHNRNGSQTSSSQGPPSPRPSTSWRDSNHAGGGASDSDQPSLSHSRTGSIYTLSRLSFASRLAQLVSIPLPTASSLQAKISSQPTAHLAARSLVEAGDQIKMWTRRACDVLKELDAQDDVEWSAAGGRDGLGGMDQAISRFEGLVKVYVISMEELQMRQDVTTLSDETLRSHVEQMEVVVNEWSKIKRDLKAIKEQVELALDWEELWNSALGEIGQELGALEDVIFAMEEKRHDSVFSRRSHSQSRDSDNDSPGYHNKSQTTPTNKALPQLPKDLRSFSASGSHSSPVKDESQLLALFARMQPLRTSLDFVPMRLASYTQRAGTLFPTGCAELQDRKQQLEQQWNRLDENATALRKELGEDKWLTVFRNSGSQAQNMFDSVERSHAKLSQALTSSTAQADPYTFSKMVESFQAKKTHYVPAIERVLNLIDKGVKDRLSVNGEILRMQSDLKKRHGVLRANIKDLEDKLSKRPGGEQEQQLRDSISTILTSEKSIASSNLDTPQSSPASSVLMRSRNGSVNGMTTPTANLSSKMPKTRRTSNLGASTPGTRPSRVSDAFRSATSPFPRSFVDYKGKRDEPFRDFKDPNDKPKWNAGGKAAVKAEKRDFLPLSATVPSPYRKTEPTPRKYTPSRYRQRESSVREESPTPAIPSITTPTAATGTNSIARKLPVRAASAMDHRSISASANMTPSKTPSSRIHPPNTSTPQTGRRTSNIASLSRPLPTLHADDADTDGSSSLGLPRRGLRTARSVSRLTSYTSRPGSALSSATARATSSGTVPAGGTSSASTKSSVTTTTTSGRRSSLGGAAARKASSSIATEASIPPVPSNLTPQGVWSRGGGRDSRLGSRAASAMGVHARSGAETPGAGSRRVNEEGKPLWRG